MKTILKITMVLLFGLFTYQASAQCNPSFTATQSGVAVQFTNTSTFTGPPTTQANLSFSWNFGDGSPLSTNYNPSHVYTTNGSYTVILTMTANDSITNAQICTNTSSQSVTVNNSCNTVVSISSQNQNYVTLNPFLSPAPGVNVTVVWDFGDGSSLTTLNGSTAVQHTYTAIGTYNICATVTYSDIANNTICTSNGCAPVTISGIITPSCSPSFTYVASGLGAQFTNTSTYAPTNLLGMTVEYSLDYGDGTPAQPLYNWSPAASHNYAAAGTYNACLTITLKDSLTSNVLCTNNYCNNVVITSPYAGCEALFTVNQDSLFNGCTFNSSASYASSGIASYLWDFGDGSTSVQANPMHTYTTPGIYNVCLTITANNTCTDNTCMLTNVSSGSVIGSTQISGTISPAGGALVYLIEYNTTTQQLTAHSSTTTSSFNSNYSFNGIPPGTYLVKAAYHVYDANYATHLPTYYTANALWNGATNLTLTPNPAANININMLPGIPTTGPGFVGGSVLTGANKTMGVGDPKHKLNVLLLDVATNQFVAVSRTDVNGDYSFSGLPIGTYKVFLEELGKTMTEADIVITAAQTSFPNIDFESNSTENHPLWATSTSNLSVDKIAYSLSQNPVSNEFSIVGLSGKESLKIYDLSGKVLKEFTSVKEGENLNIADLSNGIYMINIANEGAHQNMKMVIAR